MRQGDPRHTISLHNGAALTNIQARTTQEEIGGCKAALEARLQKLDRWAARVSTRALRHFDPAPEMM